MWERVQMVCGDITQQCVDAIVNAANSSLLGGGGVDGAIHRAAGPQLLAACREIGGCPTGQARITPGFQLPARHVIHTVGPVWQGGASGEPDLLASCYTAALDLARRHGCASVSFPAISCGVYGYPLDQAALVSLETVRNDLEANECPSMVRWVLFDDATFHLWEEAAKKLGKQR